MPTATAVKFPSVEWFEALNALVNTEDLFRKRGDGACDATVGIKSGDDVFVLTFEAFNVVGARRANAAELENLDFWLEQNPESWRAMLEATKARGRAEGNFTLNSIDLALEAGLARASTRYHDGDSRDAFYRFNQTFQDYFDASARLETAFA
jgi:hypothetical protein